MIPLNLAETGEELTVKRVGGSAEVKQHLEDLGFTAGSTLSIVNKLGGNIIVRVKESRIAINEEMARRIMV
ncbi:MAG: ferrous iron transport protein A [Clostridia bacterium]|jgi:ferrous iron transport protein A|nr:ferrous iron transport protein A [Clostridia bacterium]